MAYKQKSPVPIIEGGTNAQTFIDNNGTVIYDGTLLKTINPGTATDVLTSNNGSIAPNFQPLSAGSGSIVLLQHFPRNFYTSIVFNTISNTYNAYQLVFDIESSLLDVKLGMQLSIDGGATYISTNYVTNAGVVNVMPLINIEPNIPAGYLEYGAGTTYLLNPTSGSGYVQSASDYTLWVNDLANNRQSKTATYVGLYNTPNITVNHLRLQDSSGSLNVTGTFSLYGISQ